MNGRRHFLRQMAAAAGVLGCPPLLRGFATPRRQRPGPRFVFVVRSNGIVAPELQPAGLESLVSLRASHGSSAEGHALPLGDRALSPGLQPLEPWRERLTILQGCSGRMCKGSHGAAYGALGAYSASGELPPARETVDGALSLHLDAPFRHLGFAMEQNGIQMSRRSLSARGPGQPLPYYADPAMAYREIFGGLVEDQGLAAEAELERSILDAARAETRRFERELPAAERDKLGHYLEAFRALEERRVRLAAMKDRLRGVAPEMGPLYHSEIETERLEAHFEMAAAALIGGLSRVITIRADNLEMRLDGLGLGSKTVHRMGHMIEDQKGGGGGEDFEDGRGELAIREVVLRYHMGLIAGLAEKLAAVPEGDGTALDDTLIVYLSDHGDRHHGKFYEWPMLTLGNVGGRLKTGTYLQAPGYGAPGHRTLGHVYNTMLHVSGLPRDHFGQPDLKLDASIDQRGPLTEWLA